MEESSLERIVPVLNVNIIRKEINFVKYWNKTKYNEMFKVANRNRSKKPVII